MEFIKNIHKRFLYKKNDIPLFSYTEGKLPDFGEIGLIITKLDLDGCKFKVIDIANIDVAVDYYHKDLETQHIENVKALKKRVEWILKEWNESPENFKPVRREYGIVAYENEFMSDKQYHEFPSTFAKVGTIYYSSNNDHYMGGYGIHTYKDKKTMISILDGIDEYNSRTLKTIQNKKIKARIKRALLTHHFELKWKDVPEFIEIPKK